MPPRRRRRLAVGDGNADKETEEQQPSPNFCVPRIVLSFQGARTRALYPDERVRKQFPPRAAARSLSNRAEATRAGRLFAFLPSASPLSMLSRCDRLRSASSEGFQGDNMNTTRERGENKSARRVTGALPTGSPCQQ